MHGACFTRMDKIIESVKVQCVECQAARPGSFRSTWQRSMYVKDSTVALFCAVKFFIRSSFPWFRHGAQRHRPALPQPLPIPCLCSHHQAAQRALEL
mmetsp:Transcript_11453/g.41928  ORF Transcript_11453/g.41928 Transcript_11453/m.41928 type:complete len:97 (-) Transcript_11453:972-1262(-)